VTVRVEGKTRSLLQAKSIHTHGGFITRNGAPSGACSANSGAGALDVATKHRWTGSWSTSFNDFLISKILGDTETSSKFYWGIWINNRYATSGACGLKLHRGDKLLFAVDSVAHHEHPLAIRAPKQAVVGGSFNVKVVSYSDKGKSQPAAHVSLAGAGQGVVTNSHGVAHVVAGQAGTLKLGASATGFVRAAQVRVHVTG
jgi:hypothetical protein